MIQWVVNNWGWVVVGLFFTALVMAVWSMPYDWHDDDDDDDDDDGPSPPNVPTMLAGMGL